MIIELNKENLEREVYGTNAPVVIEFYGPDCEACKDLEPAYESIAQKFGGKLKFFKSNMYTPDSIAGQYDVKNVPVFVVVKDGKVIDRIPGLHGKIGGPISDLKAVRQDYLEKRIGRHSTSQPSSLEKKLNFSDNAMYIIEKRYLAKGKQGENLETPYEMFERVAHNIASAEKIYGKNDEEVKEIEEQFLDMMSSQKFEPNSPTLMNAGRGEQQLAACFVLPIEDDMRSIAYGVGNTAMIHKSGGGTGFSFSRLRGKNSIVSTTYGKSSGPISFEGVYDWMTEAVNQGGFRRGANMGIIRVDHPDIEEFIKCKSELDLKNRDAHSNFEKRMRAHPDFNEEQIDYILESAKKAWVEKQLNNFNLSVALTDEFMNAVKEDRDYNVINPQNGEVVRKERARKIFDLIAEHAWKNGEPGVIFLDRINKDNPTPALGEIEATNPCGEQPLLPYEACNLGSINLGKFVEDGKINYGELEKIVNLGVRFLDDVIDKSRYPKVIGMDVFSGDGNYSLNKIEEMVKGNRKIGLGVMGFADTLIKMGVPYDSEQALKIAEDLMSFIQEKARTASEKLAEERGVFPNFEQSIYSPTSPYFKGEERKLRNATLTTVAPTGTISIIADGSGGIEPIFSPLMIRRVIEGTVTNGTPIKILQPDLESKLKEKGVDHGYVLKKLDEGKQLKEIPEVPDDIRRLFVSASEISPEFHVKVQVVFQNYTDNAVSKTINLPHEATIDDVKKAFSLGYELDLKGLTVYRDGSREDQILTTIGGKGVKGFGARRTLEEITKEDEIEKDRPDVTVCFAVKSPIGSDPITGEQRTLYTVIGMNENARLIENFLNQGKGGGDKTADNEAIGRAVSKMLQKGISPWEIHEMYEGIKGDNPGYSGSRIIHSSPDAVAQSFKRVLSGEFVDILSKTAEAHKIRVENYQKKLEERRKKLGVKENNDFSNNEKELNAEPSRIIRFEKPECPDCHTKNYKIINQEGCIKYSCCGYSPRGCG